MTCRGRLRSVSLMTSMGASVKTNPRKWVLVVDDNARLCALWVAVLEKVGYQAVGSEDGPAAADLIRDSSRT